jgi:hypothetical protein
LGHDQPSVRADQSVEDKLLSALALDRLNRRRRRTPARLAPLFVQAGLAALENLDALLRAEPALTVTEMSGPTAALMGDQGSYGRDRDRRARSSRSTHTMRR